LGDETLMLAGVQNPHCGDSLLSIFCGEAEFQWKPSVMETISDGNHPVIQAI